MFEFLTSSYRRTSARPKRVVAGPCRPRLEALEDRCLMASTPLTETPIPLIPTAGVAGNVLTIEGTSANDQVVVSLVRTKGGSSFKLVMNGHTKYVPQKGVTLIRFFGRAGNDTFENNTATRCRAYGGDGSDLLTGGSNHDELFGEDGFDTLRGKGGNDYLDGGQDGDPDHLWGGVGADTFYAVEEFWWWWKDDGGPGFTEKLDEAKDFKASEGDTYYIP